MPHARQHQGRRFTSALAAALFLFVAAPAAASASTYVVNQIGDSADAVAANNSCDVDTATVGDQCTLRAAIEEANNHTGSTIQFGLGAGAHTIALGADLPPISAAGTVVDGYTAQDAAANTNAACRDGSNAKIQVTIDGGHLHKVFKINGTGVTIKGLDIQHSSLAGIEITSSGSHIEGNFIGTNLAGTAAEGNDAEGVLINAANNVVGGISPEKRNVISGNGDPNNAVGTNGGFGVYVKLGAANTIAGNLIGTNAAGGAALGNVLSGVRIDGGSDGDGNDNVVGGTDPGACNVLSGNGGTYEGRGVQVGPGTGTGIKILGNRIGTDVTGTAAIPNSPDGINLIHGASVQVGDGAGHGNLISGNISSGIRVDSSNHIIRGNRIGTNAAGTAALPNNSSGIYTNGQQGLHIGGTADGEGNLVSGNNGAGINLSQGGSDSFIQGNFVGTDVGGTTAVPNGGTGILVGGGSGNLINGGNVVSGNTFSGIVLGQTEGRTASANTVQGNFIGTDRAGTGALGNGEDGVHIYTGFDNLVGGPGAGNTIMFNGGAGVFIGQGLAFAPAREMSLNAASPLGTGNRISQNSIDLNGGLGIDLSPPGVQPNSPGAHSGGPNLYQNYPVLSSATSGAGTTVAGTLNSGPGTAYSVEFFDSAGCDASGNGEGRTYIGSTSVTTDGAGDASFSATLTPTVPVGHVVTATATDPSGNTSEFSACRTTVAATNTPVVPPPTQLPQQPQQHCVDRKPPITTLRLSGLQGTGGNVHIAAAGTALTLTGRSHDRPSCPSGVKIVQISLARVHGRTLVNCRFFRHPNRYQLRRPGNCRRPVLFTANGTTRWTFVFPVLLRPGSYRVVARATDRAGNKETPKKGRNIVPFDQP